MKIAILGVGLIGGSIGLAARRRLEAEVVGLRPGRNARARARARGARPRRRRVADAVADADVVFCAAPVGALPGLVSEALKASGEAAVVTDVGSTKRELIEGIAAGGDDSRFIGGHPLAGAETAGVENARAELIEGARWYLTPTDALERGALRPPPAHGRRPRRPAAGDRPGDPRPGHGDGQPPPARARQRARQRGRRARSPRSPSACPRSGTSFRDTTRVAGANPAIWGDIFATNSEAVAAGLDAIGARLREAAELIRSGDADAVGRWHAAAGEDRRRLLESDLAGGDVRELRIGVENRPGAVAEIALALGHAPGQHRGHGALPGAGHAHRRDLGLGRRRRGGRARRARSSAGSATSSRSSAATECRRMTRFEPGGPLRGTLTPPPDKSISHRAALLAAMGGGRDAGSGTTSTRPTRRSTLAAVRRSGPSQSSRARRRAGRCRSRGVGLRGAARRGDRR